MFAQLKGTDAEYSVNDKLREIDVANENLNSSTDYTGKVSFFKCSAAYSHMKSFLTHLNTSVQGKTLQELRGEEKQKTTLAKVNVFPSDASAAASEGSSEQKVTNTTTQVDSSSSIASEPSTRAGIIAIETLLREIDALIAQCPPKDKNPTLPTSKAAATPSESSSSSSSTTSPAAAPAGGSSIPLSSRFGSASFRTFLNLLDSRSAELITTVLTSSGVTQLPDPDVPQSEESKKWQREGLETLAKFKAESSGHHEHDGHDHSGHAHSHAKPYKLPPGVVISHGPTGVGNPPPVNKEHSHEHKDGENECKHDHEKDASAVPSIDTSTSKHARMIHHLQRYLLQSFGDIRRLDYGTGHELNFMCFVYALGKCGVFDLNDTIDAQRIVGGVFAQYILLMRKLQTTYWLEPAGSRGVWGLDDYSFLPFLFGSAQLIGHKHIKPKSVRYPEILDGFSSSYLYLDSIRFIMSVKTCSFAEHSPMLNDITIIKTWDQVNTGLWRMYQAEVLGKFAVVQHFIYSPLLEQFPIQPLNVEVVKIEDPCCSDSIHFPSSIGARVEAPKL